MTKKSDFSEAHKYSDPIPSREEILALFKNTKDSLSCDKMFKKLQVRKKSHQLIMKKRLAAMVRDGQLELKNTRYTKANVLDLLEGEVVFNKDKSVHVLTNNNNHPRLLLREFDRQLVLPKDQVLVRILPNQMMGYYKCILVNIISRGLKEFIGSVIHKNGYVYVEPLMKSLGSSVHIKGGLEYQDADLVLVEITDYPSFHKPIWGSIIKGVGDPLEEFSAVQMAIQKHQLNHHWSENVLDALKDVRSSVNDDEILSRIDWRDLPFVTIDGQDAKDYDDAVYVEKTQDGFMAYVAIADVSYYVKEGSVLDEEALERATSIYFPGKVIPMLPEKLSNGICSLKAHKDRMALGICMELDFDGKLKSSRIEEVVINVFARLTYQQVASFLDTQKDIPEWFVKPLDNLQSLYHLLSKIREKRGSLDFQIEESSVLFNQQGKVEGFKPLKRLVSHRMIEEMMLLANHHVAKWLIKKDKMSLSRVHPEPEPLKLEAVSNYFKSLGLTFPKKIKSSLEYASCLDRLREVGDPGIGEVLMLRSMPQAYYAPDSKTGHFGLGYKEYVHFTSPIRRYPDLLVHRTIKAYLHREKSFKLPLSLLGVHCS